METFADVLHSIIDTVFHGDTADKAHAIIDRASGTRTAQEPSADATAPPPSAQPSDDAPADSDV